MKKLYILFMVCVSIKVGAQTATFSVADKLLSKGRYQEALTHLKSIDTLQNLVNYKIGAIYATIENYKKSISYYKLSLDFKDSYKVRKELAVSYYKTKQYTKAIAIYEALLEKDSENLLVQFQLGKLYLSSNALDKATQTFGLLSRKDPRNPNYFYQLGLIASRRANGNAMLSNFLKAYQADKNHIKSIYQLAKTFALLRKRDSSKLFTDRGLLLDSSHVNLIKLKVNELFRNKKYKEAIGRLEKLDTLRPGDVYVKKMLARSYFNIDSLHLAKVNFKRAKALDGEDFKIWLYLGHIYKSEKKYRKAFYQYLRATSVGKKDRSEVYYSLGMFHLEMKEQEKAIRMFKEALVENNKRYKIKYQLALTSDSFYKDKKIAYKLYDEYILRFEEKDKDLSKFVKNRMKEIKENLFLEGVKVE